MRIERLPTQPPGLASNPTADNGTPASNLSPAAAVTELPELPNSLGVSLASSYRQRAAKSCGWEEMSKGVVFKSRSRLLKWLPSIQGFQGNHIRKLGGKKSGIPDGKKGEHLGGKISYKGEEETRGNKPLHQVVDNPNRIRNAWRRKKGEGEERKNTWVYSKKRSQRATEVLITRVHDQFT